MFDFYLPLEDFFLKILLEHKIENWEAKVFWLNIEHMTQFENKGLRQQMYKYQLKSKHVFITKTL